MAADMLVARAHIQNYSEASAVEPHWGYADRLVPCTSDPGSCLYLDVVYRSHDNGMLYMGIVWATIGAILLVWGVGRHFARSQPSGVGAAVVVGEGDQVPARRAPAGVARRRRPVERLEQRPQPSGPRLRRG